MRTFSLQNDRVCLAGKTCTYCVLIAIMHATLQHDSKGDSQKNSK